MGSYLNIGNELFQESLNSEIYVDKTELIHVTNSLLNTEGKLICVSRPRRFGKSMALKMLNAYYSRGCDSREMFADWKVCRNIDAEREGNEKDADGISAVNRNTGKKNTGKINAEKRKAAYEKNLNSHDVIWIDMQGILDEIMWQADVRDEVSAFYKSLEHMSSVERDDAKHPKLLAIQREIITDIKEDGEYAEYIPDGEYFLGNVLWAVYKRTGRKFIILIDEWDCIFRNSENDKLLQDKYIDWLRSMFKNTKLLPVYSLVYMTGILPVKRYGTQSALNNFMEYTFLNSGILSEFAGFTETEVKELCEEYHVDFEEMSRWYNGYVFERIGRIYNPRSVVSAIENGVFGSYWTSTGTYESVKKQIEMDFDGLKQMVVTMLGGGRCKVNTSKFQNDMVTFHSADDVLTFLVHLGYLGYDFARKETYIPNREIRDEFVNAIEGKGYAGTFAAIAKSEELLNATLEGDEEKVAGLIEQVHIEHASILKYNDENALSCIVQIAYYQARDSYKFIREMPSGKGFCDIAFLPRPGKSLPAIVVELKWNQDVTTAIDQIKEKKYGEWLKDYAGEVVLVGISYDKDKQDKKHRCRIEKVK